MTETTGVPVQHDENLQAFLRYLPKRIAAFEKRILRYRFDGWDPAGMSVLNGDVRRLADASRHYELSETRQHLLALAQMVGEHFANMRAPDPHQTERMFKLLSAVIRSLPSTPKPRPHPESGETAQATDAQQRAGYDAPDTGEMPPPAPEEIEAAADAPREAAEPVEAEESVVRVEPVEPAALVEAVELAALVDPIKPVESTEPAVLVEPVETVEPAALLETIESVEPTALVEPVEPVEPIRTIARDEPVEPAVPIEPDEPDTIGDIGMRRVYHLSDGNAFASGLGYRLGYEGYAIEPVETLDELSELLMCLMPQLLLVDASHLSELAAIGTLRHDAQQRSQPPRRIQLVVMARQDNLETRRAAHRAGADLLLFPPFSIVDVSERLQSLHSSVAKEKVRVLIVEDNRTDALFAQTVLTRAGMQADVVHDPMLVLEALKTQHPDLVLMDLHMPFANGVEVTLLIREHPVFARLPIVFLSGESDPDSRLEAINAGGDDFLFKPIRPKHLIAAVQDRVRRMHPVNRQGAVAGASDGTNGA